MSVQKHFAGAIKSCGGYGVLHKKDGSSEPIAVSVHRKQDDSTDTDSTRLGIGSAGWYSIYTPCGGAGDSLEAGDCVEYVGERYFVLEVQDNYLSGEVVYRQAVARKEMDGGES